MISSPKTAELAILLGQADNIVALTGAGLSTAAGIPDFRGPQGLYATQRYDPEMTFDIRGFEQDPRYFYQFAADFLEMLEGIRPTFAHSFLARLETAGRLSAVVTQNIDMLHQAAGSREVIELHGSFTSATCRGCGDNFADLDLPWWRQVLQIDPASEVAACPGCGGLLKPDIVFYGEMVDSYAGAEAAVRTCDLLLVLGTSLTVYPAALLPEITSAPVIVVNQGETEFLPSGDRHVVNADLDEFCRQIEAMAIPGGPGRKHGLP